MSTSGEVLEAAAELVAAFGRPDTAGYFGCFEPEATFIFRTTAERLSSRAEYEQLWQRWEHEDEFRVLSCASGRQAAQDPGDVGVFAHDVSTVVRTRADEEAMRERETIVFRRDGDRRVAAHEHLSPQPELANAQEPAT